jgi:hypothetical protein
MLTDLEKKVVAAVQGDIPICKHPYRELAEQIGISEEEFLTELKALDDRERGGEGRYGPTDFPDIHNPEALEVAPPWDGGDGTATNDPERQRAAKLDRPARTRS